MPPKYTPELFWAKVNKNGPIPEWNPSLGPCWLWTGTPRKDGYGGLVYHQKPMLAHKVAYGPIPVGLELDHLCHVRLCVRQSHLEPVTHLVNMSRGERTRRTHCAKGHPYIEANIYWYKGKRTCIACQRRAKEAWRRTNKTIHQALI